MSKYQLDWPPPYTIKKSLKSKRISLRISPKKGLEIIIPRFASQQKAIEFLNLKYDWVNKHRHLIEKKASQTEFELPTEIDFKTIGETWAIHYLQSPAIRNSKVVNEHLKELSLRGNSPAGVLPLLKNWVREKATFHLSQLLQDYSEKYQLPFNDVRVRYQHARWGSCTKLKNINLNCKLLLLPLEITHYVIVHELIHTIHFDHSPRFWRAVEDIVPNHRELRKRLKDIDPCLPNWLYY